MTRVPNDGGVKYSEFSRKLVKTWTDYCYAIFADLNFDRVYMC